MNNPISLMDENGKEVIVNMQGDIVSNDGKDNRVTLDLGGNNLYLPIGELGGKIDINIIYPNKITENLDVAKESDLLDFINNVSNGSDWDLKMNEKTFFGLGNKYGSTFLFDDNEMEGQDVGNHFFGVMGMATGLFSSLQLLQGAGIYQRWSGTSKKEWQTFKPQKFMSVDANGYVSEREIGWFSGSYGDDPRDQKWIIKGIDYFLNHFKGF